MNWLGRFMGQQQPPQYGMGMAGGGAPHPRDGSRFPLDFAAGYMQPGFQAHTGGPGQMQQGGFNAHTGGVMPPMPAMYANTGGGLPAMAQGFPGAQTGGGLPPMQGGMNAGTGGYDAPHAAFNANTGGGMAPQPVGLQAHTGGGFAPQQMGNQGGNGMLARMFRGFSPYGRQRMY